MDIYHDSRLKYPIYYAPCIKMLKTYKQDIINDYVSFEDVKTQKFH